MTIVSNHALPVVLSFALGAVLLGWLYFRRYTLTRPPLGVFNLVDLAMMVGGIILMPYLYLLLPNWLTVSLLIVGVLSILYVAWEPILRVRWAIWLATITLFVADSAAMYYFGASSAVYLAVNNTVLIVIVVSITNLWAQSGMRARDLAVLAVVLTIYDVVASWHMPLMGDLLLRLADLPFAPLVIWPTGGDGGWLALGLGDLLIATVFPLVMRKAFGRAAGTLALTVSLAVLVILLAMAGSGDQAHIFPVMMVLGPLLLIQYGYWRRRGRERTMGEYIQHEPFIAGS